MPKLGRGSMFVKRIDRKLKSLRRGLIKVRPNFGVFSPVSFPGKSGRHVTKLFLPLQVRRAARKMGISNPLVWVACPPAVDVVESLKPVGVIYQRTDRFEAFCGIDAELIKNFDICLKQKADITLYCSTSLYEEESKQCRNAIFVDHGVDFEHFAKTGQREDGNEPADLADIGRPRIGFVGGIDSHTFDPELFIEIAANRPEYQFVLVGACSLSDDWCQLDNVHQLGQRAYNDVADYMAACDVLIMPWNNSDWIKACNPVKLKEYLAVGRPVVSTWFDELEHYPEVVAVAHDADSFVARIHEVLSSPPSEEQQRARVQHETWAMKSQLVLDELEACGIRADGLRMTEEGEERAR